MTPHFLTTKNAKATKISLPQKHFTKERPVLSKKTKNFVATFRSFRQNVYVLWVPYMILTFSCFLFISLLISSTLFTTTKQFIFNGKSRVINTTKLQTSKKFCQRGC